MVNYRPMVHDDIHLALALWQGLSGIGLRDADRPESLARYLDRNPGCSFVAVDEGGGLVGVCLAGHDGRRGFLYHAAVVPRLQNQGIGRRLVEHCFTALRAEGIEKVQLWVFASNGNGREFWKRLGGRERDDLVFVSIITGENDNA